MRDRVEKRIEELTGEYAAGERMLAEVDARRADLHQTLLRIGGALQVLRELLDDDAGDDDAGGTPTTRRDPAGSSPTSVE